MTPKEKAKELVLKFEDYTDCADERGFAIKCALIAVDELLEATKRYDYTLGPKPSYNDYWLKVKYQIENL
jgi:hypothetical protein